MKSPLFNKIRCRFFDKAGSKPVKGVIATLTAIVTNDNSQIKLPLATLASDATGYMSFDVTTISTYSLVTGYLLSVPSRKLIDFDLLSLLKIPREKEEKKAYSSAFSTQSMDINQFATIVFPIYLEESPGEDHDCQCSECEQQSLPSIQSPDAYDREVSPYSFVSPSAIKLSSGCCESMAPSTLPVQQYHFYKVVVYADNPLTPDLKNVAGYFKAPPLTTIFKSATVKTVDVTQSLDKIQLSIPAIKFGEILDYKQSWYSLGHSLGEIKYSLPLAPGESTQLAVIEWTRDDQANRNETIEAKEFLRHSNKRDRSIEDTIDATLSENQDGWSLMGGYSAGATIPMEMVKVSMNAALGAGITHTSGNKNVEGNSLQDLHDKVRQKSSYVRSLTSTVIVQSNQTESSTIQTRRVANHNHCHALTIQYYEVLRHYKMLTEYIGKRKAVLIPFSVFQFTKDTALRFRQAIERMLLDPSLKDCFDALLRLELPEVYSNEMVNISNPESDVDQEDKIVTYPKYDYKLESKDKRQLQPTIQTYPNLYVKKGDIISIKATGFMLFGNAGFEIINRDADGKAIGNETSPAEVAPANAPDIFSPNAFFPAAGLSKFSLCFRIGEDHGYRDGWQQAGKEKNNIIADRDGVLQLVANDYIYADNTGTWEVTVTVKTPAVLENGTPLKKDSSETLNQGDKKDTAYSKTADKLCAYKLLSHLNSNQGYYNRVIWMTMDTVERRLYLEITLKDYPEILQTMDDLPLAVSGNYLAFPSNVSDAGFIVSPEQIKKGDSLEDIVCFPTRGLFAEAQLGHCNSCEQRDVTRMWDWKEMTVETPPEISGITPGPKGNAISVTPSQLPGNVIQITQPQNAPDPTGLANALTLLGNGSTFRDMSGLNQVSTLLGNLVKNSTDANVKAAAQSAKDKVDQVKSGSNDKGPVDKFDNLTVAKKEAAAFGLNEEETAKYLMDSQKKYDLIGAGAIASNDDGGVLSNEVNSSKLRKVKLIITNKEITVGVVRSYPKDNGKIYEVPIYVCNIVGTDIDGNIIEETFSCIRFGVQLNNEANDTPRVVGLRTEQSYTMLWVKSATIGWAWRFLENKQTHWGYYVHEGATDPQNVPFGALGCIEITGLDEWKRFNEVLLRLTGAENQSDISKNKLAEIEIEEVSTRPALKEAP